MREFLGLFKVRRDEAFASVLGLATLLFFHALMLRRSWDTYIHLGVNSWDRIIKDFVFSGFDPITYYVITQWGCTFNVYRHPLLAFMLWPLSWLDGVLMDLTGLNLVLVIIAVPLVLCAFYTFLFCHRICREIVGVGRLDAAVLSMLLLSFAYVMLTAIVPDHFCLSMFLLVFALYLSGTLMGRKGRMGIPGTALLAIVTAGVTLTNGVKIFLDALFVNGRSFFRPKYLLLAVILPSALTWGFARWEYKTFAWPKEMARKEAAAKKEGLRRERMFRAFADTVGIADTAELRAAWKVELRRRARAKYIADHKKAWNAHRGKPITKGEFLGWSDITTPRLATAVENLFGESIQFHDEHLMQDTLRSRPVIVRYSWAINYVAEGIVFLLFLLGIWCGRRSRFLWMALAGFACDLALHMGLGFGINEVYIMGGHWLFVLPIAMAYILKAARGGWPRACLRGLFTLLALYLFAYNGMLLVGYLL